MHRPARLGLDHERLGTLVHRAGPDDTRRDDAIERKNLLLHFGRGVALGEILQVDDVVSDLIARRVELL